MKNKIKNYLDNSWIDSFMRHLRGIKCSLSETFATKDELFEEVNATKEDTTNLVLALASTLKVTPKKLAKAIKDGVATDYACDLLDEIEQPEHYVKKVVSKK